MSVRFRLTITLALTLFGAALVLGVILYFTVARDLHETFLLQLRTVARSYAQLSTQSPEIRLREPPPSPLTEALGDLEVYLLHADQRLKDAFGNMRQIDLPKQTLTILQNGQEGTLTTPRNGVVLPIFSTSIGFEVAYFLVVFADDLATQHTLKQLQESLGFWLLLVIVLAAFLADRLATWWLTPMRQIAQTAAAIGQGALQQRIAHSQGKDEIAQLKQNLNAMLERLEHLVGAQQRFAAEAAHDLRTPLTVLRTELEVVLRRERDIQTYRTALEQALHQTKHLSTLAEDLLTLAKLEAGLDQIKSVHLQNDLQATWKMLSLAAAQKNVDFIFELPDNLEFQADIKALTRLCQNLLTNALQACKTRFGLYAIRSQDALELYIWDDGSGIPAAQKPQLFSRFKSGKHGTGLGLAIAQEAARAHGGKISLLEVNIPNPISYASTVFMVRFPFVSNLRLTQTQYTNRE